MAVRQFCRIHHGMIAQRSAARLRLGLAVGASAARHCSAVHVGCWSRACSACSSQPAVALQPLRLRASAAGLRRLVRGGGQAGGFRSWRRYLWGAAAGTAGGVLRRAGVSPYQSSPRRVSNPSPLVSTRNSAMEPTGCSAMLLRSSCSSTHSRLSAGSGFRPGPAARLAAPGLPGGTWAGVASSSSIAAGGCSCGTDFIKGQGVGQAHQQSQRSAQRRAPSAGNLATGVSGSLFRRRGRPSDEWQAPGSICGEVALRGHFPSSPGQAHRAAVRWRWTAGRISRRRSCQGSSSTGSTKATPKLPGAAARW